MGRAPGAAFDGDGEVGVLTDDPQLAHRLELRRAGLERLADACPVADRILVVNVAGTEEEVLVLAQRHRGVLRVGLRRAERAAPAMLAVRDPVAPADRQLALGRELPLAPMGVGARERAGVRLRPDRDRGIERVHLAQRDRRDELQLLVRTVGHQDLLEPAQLERRIGVEASLDRLAVHRQHQRCGDGVGVDAKHLSGLEPERVVQHQRSEGVVARIPHAAIMLRRAAFDSPWPG